MRTFLNWEILNRIEQSPKEYIVQRSVEMLSAFLHGYGVRLKLKNEDELMQKYSKTPSAQHYAIKKYKAHNIGTRNLTSIISFISENELDFYYNYISFLKEYEIKHPLEENLYYILRSEVIPSKIVDKEQLSTESFSYDSLPEPPSSLKEILTHMRKRPHMYFGNYDLAPLRAFLDGYFLCKKDYQISLTPFEQKIKSFTNSIVCKNLALHSEFTTWDRKYRYDRDSTSWGDINTKTEKEIHESFWKDLKVYVEMEI